MMFSSEVRKTNVELKERKHWLIRVDKILSFSEIMTWAQTKWINFSKINGLVQEASLRREGFSENSHAWGENETKQIQRKVWKLRKNTLPILITLSAQWECQFLLVIKLGLVWKMKCLNFKDWVNLWILSAIMVSL